MLRNLGIVIGKNNKTEKIFNELFSGFMEFEYDKPSDYINSFWIKYKAYPEKNSSVNGIMFEYILASLCIREGILPINLNAKVAFVPNVLYDFIFYSSEKGPICWSVKTSLRERYKQADLESMALKNVQKSFMLSYNFR